MGGFAGEFGVVVFVEYVGISNVSVCSRGTNHGNHVCGGSGNLWKVKWRSSEVGTMRNGGRGDLEAVMVSHFFCNNWPGVGQEYVKEVRGMRWQKCAGGLLKGTERGMWFE